MSKKRTRPLPDERYRIFEEGEIREALAWSAAGNVAIHLHQIVFPGSPRCFVSAVNRGEDIAHVFGIEEEELRTLAYQMGVRVIVIDRAGTPRQHVDMCAKPLKKLLALVREEEAQ